MTNITIDILISIDVSIFPLLSNITYTYLKMLTFRRLQCYIVIVLDSLILLSWSSMRILHFHGLFEFHKS